MFSFFAKRYRRRFEKKGFEASQKQLMAGLRQAGFRHATVLEIGSGVGYLHHTLLQEGAKSAMGVELSARMLEEARIWAQEKGLAERTRYIEGDFLAIADEIPPAEVVVMDKVVCCYPDAEGLVKAAVARSGRVLALTYPRDRWITRAGEVLGTILLKLIGSDFRPYVHDPEAIEEWICNAGFRKQFQDQTFIWLTQIYIKA